jgi:hypothetical protein
MEANEAPEKVYNIFIYAFGLVFWECSVRILAVLSAILIWGFRGFPQFLQKNAGIVPRLGHSRFLPNPSQFFINHPTVLCYVALILISSLNKQQNKQNKTLESTVFLNIMVHRPVEVNWRFGGRYRLHFVCRKVSQVCCLPASCWFLAWHSLRSWRWKRHIPLKR